MEIVSTNDEFYIKIQPYNIKLTKYLDENP